MVRLHAIAKELSPLLGATPAALEPGWHRKPLPPMPWAEMLAIVAMLDPTKIPRSCEVHIFGFDDQLYGAEVPVTFVEWLMDMPSPDDDKVSRQLLTAGVADRARRVLSQYGRVL